MTVRLTCCPQGRLLRSMKHGKADGFCCGYGLLAEFTKRSGGPMMPYSFKASRGFMLRSEPPLRQQVQPDCHRPRGRR